MKRVAILGATGSIGTQTCDVIRAFPSEFKLVGITGNQNAELLTAQINEFNPEYVAITDPALSAQLPQSPTIFKGNNALVEFVENCECDILMVAIVGTASLEPAYIAIKNGVDIGLACKEVLVAAGDLIMRAARQHQVRILPVDSEHAAIKQCLAGVNEDNSQIKKLILTASGGPFWDQDKESFNSITRAMALKHPSWVMGQKITIDSATLANKGLEVIEAHHLYDVKYQDIDVVIHPKSYVHSLVEFVDGNVLAHCGKPDMRFPIQYALSYPKKLPCPWTTEPVSEYPDFQFFKPDLDKFPCLKLAFQAGKEAGTSPAVLNASNEAAVKLFLDEQISFMDIPKVIEKQLEKYPSTQIESINHIIELDKQVKEDVISSYVA